MKDDRAVVIGLQEYPGLDDKDVRLTGPENDALEFKKWLLSETGGNVPSKNVKTILSSDYHPPFASLRDAKPIFNDIFWEFNNLFNQYNENIEKRKGPKIGRRLYIFMSGHGIAPTTNTDRLRKESALLMADIDPKNRTAFNYHFPGVYTASWFADNDCFEEVFLFMDCCRDETKVSTTNGFFPPTGKSDKTKTFYAFATKWSRRARERKDKDGKMMGIFTKTLLKGLDGGAAEPDPDNPDLGIITVSSLKSYLVNNMKELIDPQFLNPEVQEPDIEYYPRAQDGRDIVIGKAPLLQFPVMLVLPLHTACAIEIDYNGMVQVWNHQVNNVAAPIMLKLSRGKYLARVVIDGVPQRKLFDVTGTEEIGKERLVDFTS